MRLIKMKYILTSDFGEARVAMDASRAAAAARTAFASPRWENMFAANWEREGSWIALGKEKRVLMTDPNVEAST